MLYMFLTKYLKDATKVAKINIPILKHNMMKLK